mgnify:CR=1 FL=1
MTTAAIPVLAELVPGVELRRLGTVAGRAFNPGLVVDEHGDLLAIVRSSNYRIDALGRYSIDDPAGVVRSDLHLLRLDDDLDIVSSTPVRPPVGAHRYPSRIVGYEDARPFVADGRLYALVTSREASADERATMVLLELDDDGAVLTERVLLGHRPDGDVIPPQHEKNWVPLSLAGGCLRFVHGWDPLVIGRLDLSTGSTGFDVGPTTGWHGARGGGGGAPIEPGADERLCLVHRSVTVPDGSRRYVHRLVTIVDGRRPGRASPWFRFVGAPVEFAAGLVVDDGIVRIGFGLHDEEAWIASAPLPRILDVLEDAAEPGDPGESGA